jgi:hypothetical protein
MKIIDEVLDKLNACQEAKFFCEDKDWEEIYNTCPRGDWMLWLFVRINPKDFQLLTLAKGHCANTVRHLMKDERSLKAVDAAIAFGEGKTTKEELRDAAAAADAAAYAYAAYAASAAYVATAYTAYTASAAAYAASAAAADADAARITNRKQSADIMRKYIPIELWRIK